jgi:hypothetical protein
MAAKLPYLPSNKNVEHLFNRIKEARKPEAFTHRFLQQTIGLKGSNDRALIPLLRSLGFLDQAGKPTSAYDKLRNPDLAKDALGDGLKRAYAPLFEADEKAHAATGDRLRGLIAQVAGTDQDMTGRIAQTFTALAKIANVGGDRVRDAQQLDTTETPKKKDGPTPRDQERGERKPLRPEFHYNIQIHLPANGSEETYLNIFNALRRTFE